MFKSIHHVHFTIPSGTESAVRKFYGEALGLQEIEKPDSLKARGGVWFRLEGIQIHFGVQDGIDRAVSCSHIALEVRSLATVISLLGAQGIEVATDVAICGYQRCHTRDPWGNRLELMEALPAPTSTPETP